MTETRIDRLNVYERQLYHASITAIEHATDILYAVHAREHMCVV